MADLCRFTLEKHRNKHQLFVDSNIVAALRIIGLGSGFSHPQMVMRVYTVILAWSPHSVSLHKGGKKFSIFWRRTAVSYFLSFLADPGCYDINTQILAACICNVLNEYARPLIQADANNPG